jgi:hypothetical protein
VAPRRAFGIRTALVAARVIGLTQVVAALLAVTCVLLSVQAQAVGAAQPITMPFDHLSMGFELDGVHRDLPCECHGNNPTAETWDVLAASIATLHTGLNLANCVLCHGGETFAGVPAPYIPMSISGISPTKKTPLAPPHIPILAGTDCSACHGQAYQAGGFGPATAMSRAPMRAPIP